MSTKKFTIEKAREPLKQKATVIASGMVESNFNESFNELEKGIQDDPEGHVTVTVNVKMKLCFMAGTFGVAEPEFKMERKSGYTDKGDDTWFNPDQLEFDLGDENSEGDIVNAEYEFSNE